MRRIKNIIRWLLMPIWLPLLICGLVFGLAAAFAADFLMPPAVLDAIGWIVFARRIGKGKRHDSR